MTYTVTDEDGDTDTVRFMIAVEELDDSGSGSIADSFDLDAQQRPKGSPRQRRFYVVDAHKEPWPARRSVRYSSTGQRDAQPLICTRTMTPPRNPIHGRFYVVDWADDKVNAYPHRTTRWAADSNCTGQWHPEGHLKPRPALILSTRRRKCTVLHLPDNIWASTSTTKDNDYQRIAKYAAILCCAHCDKCTCTPSPDKDAASDFALREDNGDSNGIALPTDGLTSSMKTTTPPRCRRKNPCVCWTGAVGRSRLAGRGVRKQACAECERVAHD